MKRLVILLLFLTTGYSGLSQLTIRSINFYGETKNKLSYLDNYVTSEVGDVASLESLEKDRKNLVNLPKYGHVHLRVDTVSEVLDITFELYEVQTISPIINIGGVTDNVFWQAGVANSSSFGIGLGYKVFYTNTDKRSNYNLDFKYPYIKGKRIGLEFNFSKNASLEPVFFSEQAVQYDYDKSNYGLGALIYITPRNILTIKGSYFVEGFDIHMENSGEYPTGFEHRKILFSQEFNHNNENYFYYFVNGYSLYVKFTKVTNLDDESHFNMVLAQYKYYKRILKKGNLAVRFQAGIATNSDSPFAPFVLDSNLNIRGAGNRQERGTASVITNVEYRHTFLENNNFALQSVVFADAGVWRKPGDEFNIDFAQESLRLFTGGGFRLNYKKFSGATFRVDYGVDTSDKSQSGIVFGIGQYF